MMGGKSFKCPECDRWFFEKQNLKDHLIGKHKYERGFTIEGVAGGTHIDREKWRREASEFLSRLPKVP